MNHLKIFWIVLVFLSILCCKSKNDAGNYCMAWKVEKHLKKMINTMKFNSINRDEIEWEEFEDAVYKKASGARTIEDGYPAVKLALDLLGDHHSIYIKENGAFILGERKPCERFEVSKSEPLSDIGYIEIGTFNGMGDNAKEFAQNIQDEIRKQDNVKLKGWIIDLRNNMGGNMWPMVLGISPLLDSDRPVYFSSKKEFDDSNKKCHAWKCANGEIRFNFFQRFKIEDSYESPYPPKKIAVLISNWTMSAGEAVAVALKGNVSTRFFGMPTCGLTTANNQFKLPDGAKLLLSVCYFVDRNKNVYTKSIQPDEINVDPRLAIESAIHWINNSSLQRGF